MIGDLIVSQMMEESMFGVELMVSVCKAVGSVR